MTSALVRESCLSNIDVLVLAGGLGSRLRPIFPDLPKILVPLAGKPFLEYLLEWLASFGSRRVIFSLGHLADQVVEYLANRSPSGMSCEAAVEDVPLGTAGAIRHLRFRLRSDPVLVLNGDTLLDADLSGFVAEHRTLLPPLSLLCAQMESGVQYGSVEIDEQGYVRRITEKDASRNGHVIASAGVYLFSSRALDDLMASGAVSLERDFLPLRPAAYIRAYVMPAAFIDIGTPENYAKTDRMMRARPKAVAPRGHA